MVKGIIFAFAVLACKLLAFQTGPAVPPRVAEPLPLTQIASREEDLHKLLRDISRDLPVPSQLEEFREQLTEREESVRESLDESAELLAANATIMEIHEQAREWRVYGAPEARQRKLLAGWGASCEKGIALLKEQEAVWRATLESTQSLEELAAVRLRARRSVEDIQTLKAAAEERLRTIVELQGSVSKQASAIADMIEKLRDATQTFQKRLFHADAPPIWKVSARKLERESLGALFRRAVGRSYSNSTELVLSRQGLIIEVVLFVAFAFAGVRWVGAAVSKGDSSDPWILRLPILNRRVALTVLMTAPLVLGFAAGSTHDGRSPDASGVPAADPSIAAADGRQQQTALCFNCGVLCRPHGLMDA